MGIQEAVDKAKKGVVKDVAKVWVDAGYTAADFDLLKSDVYQAAMDYEYKIEKFNEPLDVNKGEVR